MTTTTTTTTTKMPRELIERFREAALGGPKQGAENRGEPRVAVGAVVAVTVMPADAYSTMSTLTMKLDNFSDGGIGLLSGETVTIGSDVILQFRDGEGGGRRFDLRCVVCSCKAVADGVFRLGVKYDGPAK
jgi:hypothetical protein